MSIYLPLVFTTFFFLERKENNPKRVFFFNLFTGPVSKMNKVTTTMQQRYTNYVLTFIICW